LNPLPELFHGFLTVHVFVLFAVVVMENRRAVLVAFDFGRDRKDALGVKQLEIAWASSAGIACCFGSSSIFIVAASIGRLVLLYLNGRRFAFL